MKTTPPTRLSNRRQKQKGIVLALVIVLLGIISLVGAISMRNATQTEQTTNSLRTAASAQQAAELGLKFCELVAQDTKAVTYSTARPKIMGTITAAINSGAWSLTPTWTTSANNFITVPASYAQSTDANSIQFKTANLPQCIIERLGNAAGRGYVVTARGFGNDAVINSTNGVTSGAEAWVQSVLIE